MRLIDKMRRYGVSIHHDDQFKPILRKLLTSATFVVADNICRYFYASEQFERYLPRAAFPNLAPPFPIFWMETRRPPGKDGPPMWGSLFVAERGVAGWEMHGKVFVEDTKVVCLPLSFVMSLSADGSVVDVKASMKERDDEWAAEVFRSAMAPLFLAISFMHCNNVSVVEQIPPPRLSRAHERRGHPALVTYKTIVIDGAPQTQRVALQQEPAGIEQPLSIYRGHFKDYRECGLFGRNKGLYWWNAHLRGSVEHGVVIRDYDVGPVVDEGIR